MSLLYIRTAKTGGSTIENWFNTNAKTTLNAYLLSNEKNKKIIKDAIEGNFFIFTSVRNPFTRAISQWQQALRSNWLKPNSSFEDFFEFDYKKNEVLITHCGTLYEVLNPYLDNINKFIKIENFKKEIEYFIDKFKLPKKFCGHLNKGNYFIDLKSFYTKKRIDLVASKYDLDFKTFKYSRDVNDF